MIRYSYTPSCTEILTIRTLVTYNTTGDQGLHNHVQLRRSRPSQKFLTKVLIQILCFDRLGTFENTITERTDTSLGDQAIVRVHVYVHHFVNDLSYASDRG